GIFRCAANYCKSISPNVRIDTHENNTTMQRQIEKAGFERCGIIYVEDGSPRIAYQWTAD
ncbi:MAG: N-acetyltransferase, partial [Clostridiales bacterium]|nr:N-acetyltransferase [Clostridiales bacterium]